MLFALAWRDYTSGMVMPESDAVAQRTSRRCEEIPRFEALQSLRLIVEARNNLY
jgi:hypothetical protein